MRIGTNVLIGVSLLAVGCVDSGPVGFDVPAEAALNRTAALSISVDEIDEHPERLAMSEEVPAFAGLYMRTINSSWLLRTLPAPRKLNPWYARASGMQARSSGRPT